MLSNPQINTLHLKIRLNALSSKVNDVVGDHSLMILSEIKTKKTFILFLTPK